MLWGDAASAIINVEPPAKPFGEAFSYDIHAHPIDQSFLLMVDLTAVMDEIESNSANEAGVTVELRAWQGLQIGLDPLSGGILKSKIKICIYITADHACPQRDL